MPSASQALAPDACEKDCRSPQPDANQIFATCETCEALKTYDWSVPIDVIEWENSKKADFRAISALLRAHGMEAIGKNKHDQVWASAAVRDRLHEKGTRSFEAAVGHQGRNDPAFDCTFEPGAYRG